MVGLALLTVAAAPVSAAGVVNGGFETGDLTGWVNPGLLWQATQPPGHPYAAYEGGFLASAQDSILSQDIATTPGETYQLSFAFNPGGVGSLSIFWSSTSPVLELSGVEDKWTLYTVSVLATSSTSTLGFSGTGEFSGLDSVALQSETPLPAALPLFASVLGIGGWLARRKKRKSLAA